MNNVLVSVIVPIYNAEDDLERCIQSILNQTYMNVEILLVDDGSIDSSSDICKRFENLDKRVLYFRHDNEGVSFTRNRGVSLSKGKWICFIDSDDSVEENYVSQLLEDTEGSEFVIHGINILDSLTGKSIIVNPINYGKRFELGIDSDFLKYVPVLCLASPISKLFKRSIIVSNGITFDVRVNIGEDYLFTIEYLCNVSYVVFKPCVNYNYFRSGGSLSTTYNTFEGEVLAEQILYNVTLKLGEKLNITKGIIVDFYNFEFRKHAYRILFSLYSNRFVFYNKKDRMFLFNQLSDSQLFRLEKMFVLNGLTGKIISIFFSKRLFFFSDEVFKFLVNKKIK